VAPKNRLGRGLDALLPVDDDEPSSGFLSRGNAERPITAPAGTATAGAVVAIGTSEADNAVKAAYAAGAADAVKAANAAVNPEFQVITIPLDKLKANPGQPRKHFDEESLRELADSVREHGVIQPLIVEDAGDGTWVIVAGERRSRAALLAGLTGVPALIRNYTDEKRMEVALIENVQRSDLNPIEEAAAYRRIMDLTACSQDEVAVKVGKNRSTVANALRLLKLPPLIRKALEENSLSPGHGRAILAVQESATQERLFREILARGLSVREAEKRAAALNADAGTASNGSKPNGAQPNEAALRRDPELAAMEQRFIDRLGTKVAIKGDFKKGNIQIEYYSMDDLDRLLGILG
jgi:ParB family chromosome partitioning protein